MINVMDVWTHCSWCMDRQTFFWVSGKKYECKRCHHQKELQIVHQETVVRNNAEVQV